MSDSSLVNAAPGRLLNKRGHSLTLHRFCGLDVPLARWPPFLIQISRVKAGGGGDLSVQTMKLTEDNTAQKEQHHLLDRLLPVQTANCVFAIIIFFLGKIPPKKISAV